MFNDDFIKLESQLLVIDVMMKSIDNILDSIKEKNIKEEPQIRDLITKIFTFCEKIIEMIPQFELCSSTVSRRQLLNSISTVRKYWSENDADLFNVNWFLFLTQWTDFSDVMKKILGNNSVNFFSLN